MKIFKLLFFVIIPLLGKAQNCCDTDNVSVVCYTASADYCPIGINCRYTLDAQNMTGLNQKLNNSINFGPNGISSCDIELAPLININTVTDIENLECDIIIVGNFALNNNAGYGTHLETSFLNTIKDWSLECEENLTILFQGEAEVWGYEILDENQNPNVAGNVQDPNIFDGPFGSLTQFNQGGSFQANFTTLPSTGSTILGVDANGRPTIVLDILTNDIILADVGIMCNGSGDVTDSPNVTNANDILACNIIALGCEIAGMEEVFEEVAVICEGDSYILPDGEIVNIPGTYPVTLIGNDDCDSIIVTYLDISTPEDIQIAYIGCVDDGYSLQIGADTYDETNPRGETILLNEYNCDSIVIVDLVFNSHSFGTYESIICLNDTLILHNNMFIGPVDTSIVIVNSNGCDSIIDVNILEIPFDNIFISDEIIIENNQSYVFDNSIPTNYNVYWSPSSGLSCDDCTNPTLKNVSDIPVYTVTIESPEGCEIIHEIAVIYNCSPYVPNVFNPKSIAGNDLFSPLAPCRLQTYSLVIYDRWGNLVFESTDPDESWDGRFKTKIVPPGVYVYQLKFSNQGIEYLKSASMTILH